MDQAELFEADGSDGDLAAHPLPDGSPFFVGSLPTELVPDDAGFEALWALHPDAYHVIQMHGRLVETPRYQQAYGADYYYTGRTNRALPVPESLAPFLAWGRAEVDERLNGILLNWYAGELGHYIGPHRDSTRNMVDGSPIVTISLGERRVFRLRPYRGQGKVDFPTSNGSVFVLPYSTNLLWTHEVPRSKRLRRRRISITLRAFES